MKKPSSYKDFTFQSVYFLGIGGIGMSALARYFNQNDFTVCGYDKTPSDLTRQLEKEGIEIHYEDDVNLIPEAYITCDESLVVYTPAIPTEMKELQYFRTNGFTIMKRSEVLGWITQQQVSLGVAGTHGKTTTSSMLAHVIRNADIPCNAFLGGISTNINSNLLLHPEAKFTVVEADEFDRSFLALRPFASIITSTDPDHLDIYEDTASFREGFQSYANLIPADGILVARAGLGLGTKGKLIDYSTEDSTAMYWGHNLRFSADTFLMDLQTAQGKHVDIELGVPGKHNAENAVAVWALCKELGIDEIDIRKGLATFKGVKRRFEYLVKKEKITFIDDYAHHPTEIAALITSVREMYPEKKVSGIFQPHLYSRTKDFFQGFCDELAKLDDLTLLPIYAAREKPINGITSEALLSAINLPSKRLLSPLDAVEYAADTQGILLTIGAGDIDRIVPLIQQKLA